MRDLDILPELIDMGAQATSTTFTAGLGLSVVGVALLLWRANHTRALGHTAPRIQRLSDVLLPVCLAGAGVGIADADWGWACGLLGLGLAWTFAILASGRAESASD